MSRLLRSLAGLCQLILGACGTAPQPGTLGNSDTAEGLRVGAAKLDITPDQPPCTVLSATDRAE